MNEPPNAYRDVLEDLARSRGYSGAEELARQAAVEDLENPPMGSGAAIDRVLDLNDEERLQLSEAFGQTFWR